MTIWLVQRQPKLGVEDASRGPISHNTIIRKAANPTTASLDISMPERRPGYFLRRKLRMTYTMPTPLASRARLDGSGTGRNVAPAKAAGVALQIASSDASETGTKRLIIISMQ